MNVVFQIHFLSWRVYHFAKHMALYSFSQKCLTYILFTQISISNFEMSLLFLLQFRCTGTGIFSAAESWWLVRELKRTSGLQTDWPCFSEDTFLCRYGHGNSVRIIRLGLCSDREWLRADVYSEGPAALYKHPTRSTFVSILFHSVAYHPTAVPFSATDGGAVFTFTIWAEPRLLTRRRRLRSATV